DGRSPVLLSFYSEEVEENAFGWVVDNGALRKVMYERFKSLKTAKLTAPCTVKNCAVDEETIALKTDRGDIQAKLLIGADGRKSWVREHMNVAVNHKDYNQHAVICAVAHDNPHGGVAIEHFRE